MSYAMVHFLNERDVRQAFLAGERPADPNVSQETGKQPRHAEEVPSGSGAQGQCKSSFSHCIRDMLIRNLQANPRS